MQTFLPYPDLKQSVECLDRKRCFKQILETRQIATLLVYPHPELKQGWVNHPAVLMWKGYEPVLCTYGLVNCVEWARRGYKDTQRVKFYELLAGLRPRCDMKLPPWFGLDEFHLSHKSNLIRKDEKFYRPLFGDIPNDLPYYWPTKQNAKGVI